MTIKFAVVLKCPKEYWEKARTWNSWPAFEEKKLKLFILTLTVFLTISGCAPTMPDMIVRNYPFAAAGKFIVLEPFRFPPEISTGWNRTEGGNLGTTLALELQKQLRQSRLVGTVVIAPGDEVIGDFLIRGRITRVTGGDRFHRVTFELFGYGAAEVQARGEVVDVRTGTALTAFSFTRISFWTWKENEGAVRENTEAIAQAIAEIVLQEQR